jgi:hypothetical protein
LKDVVGGNKLEKWSRCENIIKVCLRMYAGFWWESPKERDHLKDRDVDGKMGLEWILG